MNKVVNIEMAGQVFWIEEEAYNTLTIYLKKIKQQLHDEELAQEIYQDVELRFAELMFSINGDRQKALLQTQIEGIIKQIGFFEDEDIKFEPSPQKNREYPARILAGVCAKLSVSLNVPAFILRILFLGGIFVGGIGVLFYLVFWVFLDSDNKSNVSSANQNLARQNHNAYSIQHLIFLPIALIGSLLTLIVSHITKRLYIYRFIFKNIVALAMIFLFSLALLALYHIYHEQWLPIPVNFLFIAAVAYLLILALAVYVREFYLYKSFIKIKKAYKLTALAPLFIIIAVLGYLVTDMIEKEKDKIVRSFPIKENTLNIVFNETQPENIYSEHVKVLLKTNTSNNTDLRVTVEFESRGRNSENIGKHIQSVEYGFNVIDDTLNLDKYFTLPKNQLNRGQNIVVVIEIPQAVYLHSSHPLKVYKVRNTYVYKLRHDKEPGMSYISSEEHYHEIDNSRDRVSANERFILLNTFCETFFIHKQSGCRLDIKKQVAANRFFDHAFDEDIATIDKIRALIQPNRNIFVKNLIEISALNSELAKYPSSIKFQNYLETLIKIKTQKN